MDKRSVQIASADAGTPVKLTLANGETIVFGVDVDADRIYQGFQDGKPMVDPKTGFGVYYCEGINLRLAVEKLPPKEAG